MYLCNGQEWKGFFWKLKNIRKMNLAWKEWKRIKQSYLDVLK